MLKRIGASVMLGILYTQVLLAQTVPAAEMQRVYDEIKTPYKYGLVVVPKNDAHKTDSPTVFRHQDKWYMTYIVYDGQHEQDGRGYETWLAQSDNLLDWKTLGRILSFSEGTWDSHNKAGYLALQDPQWEGTYQLQPYEGKYWMSYLGGDTQGYEAGRLSVGMAYTGTSPVQVHEWSTLPRPVLTPTDSTARWWENATIYKSSVIWDQSRTLKYPFVMFYNAKGNSAKSGHAERIGLAVSDDMRHWKRYLEDPVLDHQVGITGDAQVQRLGKLWVMFYFGAFWENKKGAFNRFACSYDLAHWTDWTGPDLIAPSEPYDNRYAHKSFVLKYQGVVYHFYCAVNDQDQRGIAVATSVDRGKSTLHFR